MTHTQASTARKTVLLNVDFARPGEEPRKYKVVFESDTLIEVDGGRIVGTMTLRKQEDGSFVNGNGVRFLEHKADRRAKPFSVRYSGMDGREEKKFATLAEAAAYVWDRYQGVEYFDGPAAFHTDYGAYALRGFALADIYVIDYPNYSATRKEVA